MEVSYVPATGMVLTAQFIVPPEMTILATSLVIHKRDKGSAIQAGTGRTVVHTVLLRTVIGLVITTVIRSMAVKSAIETGTELVALSFALLMTMTSTAITRATELMVAKFVGAIGLELSAERIAKQETTHKGITIVASRMGQRYAINTGLG